MCNGSSSRTSQGGTIAFLQPKPNSSSHRPNLHRSLSLHLACNTLNGQTTATFNGLLDEGEETHLPGSYFVIHRDGDLSSTSAPAETTVLHRFALPQLARHGQAFDLDQRLDLGVGGEGVIGRRVSFVTRGEGVVGEGIFGWN